MLTFNDNEKQPHAAVEMSCLTMEVVIWPIKSCRTMKRRSLCDARLGIVQHMERCGGGMASY